MSLTLHTFLHFWERGLTPRTHSDRTPRNMQMKCKAEHPWFLLRFGELKNYGKEYNADKVHKTESHQVQECWLIAMLLTSTVTKRMHWI
jgi:hypothetical protein